MRLMQRYRLLFSSGEGYWVTQKKRRSGCWLRRLAARQRAAPEEKRLSPMRMRRSIDRRAPSQPPLGPAPTATAAATPAPPGRTEQLGFKPQVACQQLINNVDEPNGLRLKSKKKARKGRKVPVGRGAAEPALRPPRPCWWPTALAWPRLSRRGRATPL